MKKDSIQQRKRKPKNPSGGGGGGGAGATGAGVSVAVKQEGKGHRKCQPVAVVLFDEYVVAASLFGLVDVRCFALSPARLA